MSNSNEATTKDTPDTSADSDGEEVFHDARFPPEEEKAFLEQSHVEKSDANKLFASARYSEAVSTYDRALASCPNYLDYEVAVLRSNIAACHLKLEDWKAAVDAATTSLECLDKILPGRKKDTSEEKPENGESGGVVEIEGEGEDAEQAELERLRLSDERIKDIKRIRTKSLLRRARGRSELGGWANLQGAEEDYKELIKADNLPPGDGKVVRDALRKLPTQINEAKEKEMGEMMGKLKDLGNGILKPFGLSTDNFKFVQDPKSGGYNMSFES
ncbi:hypothetical protein FQN54_006668 [Arachnomyces sp. PD_36]|nr:hypothetical protein FQN54_006668 [Arachnomyces sp. PD_36]